MGLFGRKKNIDTEIAPTRVQIEMHKNATREALKKADQANAHLNELLVENGFTLKIFLAAGGHPPKSGKA